MNKIRPLDVNLCASYDYHLPKSLIASHPITPKENARLLVYERKNKNITHAHFGELFSFLPKDISILLNDTKVIKARIFGSKPSGGKVELLLNSPLCDNTFKVYIKGRVRVNSKLFFDEKLQASVLALNEDGTRVVKFFQNGEELDAQSLFKLLNHIGHVPLPPYIKREDTKEDEDDYQTIFAKNEGAVAAPTASLHFSEKMFEELQKRFETNFLTLHVGAGTFKGVECERLDEHIMHSEYFSISNAAKRIIKSDKALLGIGTTVTRTVEYFARTKEQQGFCDLFLNPLNPPVRINHLLTNFHLPRSTLIMLVAGFIGLEETLRVYGEAVKEKYRFFSYGDAMLIL
ncbi:MAG: tRNA preQ1(34) S-adenosylmethionine ribosyltransferase-isomerase QueA [Campylobacteraceae bacterium]|jgi:S-adenosylmethionine:tRNA ribosyltransferase-isomerase|nr:tRNA preQ1(34) S-adenosylmethionine ribosyltransferase-isomerase QueA [Campylobacteraceae bacterium]